MVSPYAVEVASRNRVFVDIEETADGIYVPHIEPGRNIDLVVVYPASVNIIGKVANGIADKLISTLILATPWRDLSLCGCFHSLASTPNVVLVDAVFFY